MNPNGSFGTPSSSETRLTRAMACSSPYSLSRRRMYRTGFRGASKPVSSLSTTMIMSSSRGLWTAPRWSCYRHPPRHSGPPSCARIRGRHRPSDSSTSSSLSRISGAEMITSAVPMPKPSKSFLSWIAARLDGAASSPFTQSFWSCSWSAGPHRRRWIGAVTQCPHFARPAHLALRVRPLRVGQPANQRSIWPSSPSVPTSRPSYACGRIVTNFGLGRLYQQVARTNLGAIWRFALIA